MAFRRSSKDFLLHRAYKAPAEILVNTLNLTDNLLSSLHSPLAIRHSDAAAGLLSLLHHGVFEELLLASEHPSQREAFVRQGVHQSGVGVGEERFEELAVRPCPASRQPGFLRLLAARLSGSSSLPAILQVLVACSDSWVQGGVHYRLLLVLILQQTCGDPEILQHRHAAAAVDDDGGDDDEKGCAEDHLPTLGDGVPDGQSEGDGSPQTGEHHHVLETPRDLDGSSNVEDC